MSDQLIHVRDKDGNETYVGQAWLDRWPQDFKPVKARDVDTTAPAAPIITGPDVSDTGTNFAN